MLKLVTDLSIYGTDEGPGEVTLRGLQNQGCRGAHRNRHTVAPFRAWRGSAARCRAGPGILAAKISQQLADQRHTIKFQGAEHL